MAFFRIALFCFALTVAARGAEPTFFLKGELNAMALSGLMDAWDMDVFQEKIGLPANLRHSTVQEYLVEEAQLKELPETLAKEVTGAPFLPEGKLDAHTWKAIHARWKALPVRKKLPVLKISHFDSDDQARALIWGLKQGASLPPLRKAADPELRNLVESFEYEAGNGTVKFVSKKGQEDLGKAMAAVEALLQVTRDEADLHWVVESDSNRMELAERYRLQVRVQTAEDSFQIVDKKQVSLFWHDTEILEGWIELLKLPEEEAKQKLNETLKASFGKVAVQEWTAFINDPQSSLTVLADNLEYFASWPASFPECQEFVLAFARAMQSRLRPFKVLQMGPKTDVVALLRGIQVSANLLPPEERKITLAHGAFPLALEYQMRPEPEPLAKALALLARHNPKAVKSAISHLASDPQDAVFPLIAELSGLGLPDPELSAALDEAVTRWHWTADREPAAEPEKAELPYAPAACHVGLNSLVPLLP